MEQCAKRLLQAILQAKPDEDGRSFKEGSVREDELSHERARPSSADEMDGMDDGIPDCEQPLREIQNHVPVAVGTDIQRAVCEQSVAVAQGRADSCQ